MGRRKGTYSNRSIHLLPMTQVTIPFILRSSYLQCCKFHKETVSESISDVPRLSLKLQADSEKYRTTCELCGSRPRSKVIDTLQRVFMHTTTTNSGP